MKRDIAIVGCSGFGREIQWLIERYTTVRDDVWNFIGFIDKTPGEHVIGDDDYLMSYKNKLSVLIAIADGGIRKRLYERYKKNVNLLFPSIVDPSVLISDDTIMGMGNIICAGNIVTVGVKFGNFDIVNLNCTIGHESEIGDYVTLNPACNVSGNVHIGEQTCVGTGSQILQGLEIEDMVTIGAGAVVTKNIHKGITAVGVPAREIKRMI